MTNEEKALQIVKNLYPTPEDIPVEILKNTFLYHGCLLSLSIQNFKKAMCDIKWPKIGGTL